VFCLVYLFLTISHLEAPFLPLNERSPFFSHVPFRYPPRAPIDNPSRASFRRSLNPKPAPRSASRATLFISDPPVLPLLGIPASTLICIPQVLPLHLFPSVFVCLCRLFLLPPRISPLRLSWVCLLSNSRPFFARILCDAVSSSCCDGESLFPSSTRGPRRI